MKKHGLIAASLVALLSGTAAQAQNFESLRATANTAGGPVTQVNTVQGTANAGASFVNQYTSGAFPVVGDRVRSVAADIITGYTTNPGGVVVGSGAPAGQKYTMVFVADGTITAATAGVSATVAFSQNSGQVFLFQSQGGFTANDPTTWGISNAPVASWTIESPQNLVPGNAFANPNFFLAGQVNNFTANSGAGQQTQGRVLFRDTNDPFLPVTDPVAAGFAQVFEGLWANIQETVAEPSVFPFTGGAASLALLNQLAALAGLGDLGGANTGFATGLGAGVTDFNPSATVSTGDISFTLGAAFIPGRLVRPLDQPADIPEPASMLLWGLATAGMGIYGGLRRARRA